MNKDPARLTANRTCTSVPVRRDTGMTPYTLIRITRSGTAPAYAPSIAQVTLLNPKHEPPGRNKRKSRLPERAPPTRKGHNAAFDKPAYCCCDVVDPRRRVLEAHDEEGTLIEVSAGDRFRKTNRLTSKWRKELCETADKINDKPQVSFADCRLVRKNCIKIGRSAEITEMSCHERKTKIEEAVVQKVVGLSRWTRSAWARAASRNDWDADAKLFVDKKDGRRPLLDFREVDVDVDENVVDWKSCCCCCC
jgi:hypothetical protein